VPWIKLWTEARTDRKLDRLTDAQHRVWFNLLLFAAEQDERGTFADDGSLALEVARGRQKTLDATIEALRDLHIIVDESGRWAFRAFDKRQARKPSDNPEAARKRKRRQREKEAEEAVSHPVTPLSRPVTRDGGTCHAEVEGEGEEEVEVDGEVERAGNAREDVPPRGDMVVVATEYERLTGNTCSSAVFAKLCADHPTDRLIEAVRVAAERGKTGVGYIRGIAQSLASEGWKPPPVLTDVPNAFAAVQTQTFEEWSS
jgi:hypothetical protein